MERLLDRLIGIIGDEAVLFEEFLELLEQQQRTLISGDSGGLRAVTAKAQELALESQKLERRRVEAVEEIRRVGGAEADRDVSRICDMADPERTVQLRAIRTTILDLYGKIKETRMRHGLLIEQSLEQIRNTIDMIERITARKSVNCEQGGVSREFHTLAAGRKG